MINPYIFIQMWQFPSWSQMSQKIAHASSDTAQRYREKEVSIAIRTGIKLTGCYHN